MTRVASIETDAFRERGFAESGSQGVQQRPSGVVAVVGFVEVVVYAAEDEVAGGEIVVVEFFVCDGIVFVIGDGFGQNVVEFVVEEDEVEFVLPDTEIVATASQTTLRFEFWIHHL